MAEFKDTPNTTADQIKEAAESSEETGSDMPESDRGGQLQDADAMIMANGEAEARQTQSLRERVASYENQLQQMQKLYHQNCDLLDQMRSISDENSRRMQQLTQTAADDNAKTRKNVEEVSGKVMNTLAETDKAIRENANMQLQIADLAQKTMELQKSLNGLRSDTSSLQSSIDGLQQRMSDLIQQSDDFAHKEHVRVYRNIQAATEQSLQKYMDELKQDLETVKTAARPKVSPLQILTLIFAILAAAAGILNAAGLSSALMSMLNF